MRVYFQGNIDASLHQLLTIKNFHCDMSASLSVGESMMMIGQIEATVCSDGMKLMIFQIRKDFNRIYVCAIKLIIRISHFIMRETSLEAALFETFVMSDKRQVSHIFRSLTPHLWEDRRVVGVFFFDSMNLGIPVTVIIGDRFYQTIESVHNLPVFNDDDTDAARAPDIAVRRLKIYGCKVREIGHHNLIVSQFQHLILLSQRGKYLSRRLQTYIPKCSIDLVCRRLGTTVLSLS